MLPRIFFRKTPSRPRAPLRATRRASSVRRAWSYRTYGVHEGHEVLARRPRVRCRIRAPSDLTPTRRVSDSESLSQGPRLGDAPARALRRGAESERRLVSATRRAHPPQKHTSLTQRVLREPLPSRRSTAAAALQSAVLPAVRVVRLARLRGRRLEGSLKSLFRCGERRLVGAGVRDASVGGKGRGARRGRVPRGKPLGLVARCRAAKGTKKTGATSKTPCVGRAFRTAAVNSSDQAPRGPRSAEESRRSLGGPRSQRLLRPPLRSPKATSSLRRRNLAHVPWRRPRAQCARRSATTSWTTT